MNEKIRQLLEDARSEFADLRQVPGEKTPSPGEQVMQSRERALQYLRGNADQLAALGSSLLGAVLAAVGPQLFNIRAAGRVLLRDVVEEGEFPDDFWETLNRQITHAGAVSDAIAMLAASEPHRAILAEACYLSSRLMAEDQLRSLPFYAVAEKKKAAAKSAKAEQSAEAPPPASQSTALTVLDVRNALLARSVSVRETGRMLLSLPVPARAMAIASSFQKAVDAADPSEADHVAEISGRRLERALEETGRDQTETLRAMIEAGDIYAVLSMVRGEAGTFSSTAEHLESDLVRELFERDADMSSDKRPDRLLQIAYTLVVQTAPSCAGINDFFNSLDGQSLLSEVAGMKGDEDAAEILRTAGERGILVEESWLAEDEEDAEGEGEEEDDGMGTDDEG